MIIKIIEWLLCFLIGAVSGEADCDMNYARLSYIHCVILEIPIDGVYWIL